MMKIQPDTERVNILYLLSTEGITKVLSFLGFVIMARGLTQGDYGIVTLAFSVGSLFFIFFNFGVDYHLIRDVKRFIGSEDIVALKKFVSSAAVLKIWSFPFFILMFVAVFWFMRWNPAYFPVMALLFFYFYIMSAIQIVLFFFRAFERMKYEFYTRVLQAISLLVAVFLFAYVYKSILFVVVGYVSIASVTLIGLLFLFKRKVGIAPDVGRWMQRGEFALIGKTKYLFLTGICTSIFSGIDILIISKIVGVEGVAMYRNAVMITLSLFLIPTAVVQGVYPKLVQHEVELRVFFQMIKKVFARLLPIGIVVASLFFILGSRIIILVFGDTYAAAAPLFRMSLLAFLFATVNQVLGYGMIAIGKYKSYFLITLAVSVVSVFLNIVLISKIGLLGGIVTLNISHFLLILLPVAYLYMVQAGEKRESVVTAI